VASRKRATLTAGAVNSAVRSGEASLMTRFCPSSAGQVSTVPSPARMLSPSARRLRASTHTTGSSRPAWNTIRTSQGSLVS
jgi:hypothetical protein